MTSERVKARIPARQVVYYDQDVYVPRDEWEAHQRAMDSDAPGEARKADKLAALLAEYLDLNEVCGADDFDGCDVEVELAREAGGEK